MKQILLVLSLFGSLKSCVDADGFTPLERRKISQFYKYREHDMFEHFRPLGKNILVRLNLVDEKTASGLFMASLKKEDQRIATVIAIGPDVFNVCIGDVIYIGRILVRANDEMCILIEDDVLGIFD